MIYLIITSSINNRFGSQNIKERKDRYLYAINETLKLLPSEIIPIIVENNGKRDTYLDDFFHNQQRVSVFYTNSNKQIFKSKGVNEMIDIKEVINEYGIKDDDMIIKLTGRYRAISDTFFRNVIENESKYDSFIKFFGACSLQFEQYDCILGCYAMRAKYFKLFNYLMIDNYKSAEIAFAKYVRLCGARIQEINQLDIECLFAEDLRILNV